MNKLSREERDFLRQVTKRPLFDIDIARDYLEYKKITLKFDVISREIVIEGLPEDYDEDRANSFFTLAFDEIRKNFSVSRQHCDDLFRTIAIKNSFNPILETLYNVVPDGKDHFTELLEILNIDDELSKTLIYKWLMPSYALLHNSLDNPCSADGMLVFVGRQGVGKSSFAKALGKNFKHCKLGVSIDPRNKDSLIAATGAWIVEIAELESTLRGDLQVLKAFLTAESDEIRRPYDRFAVRVPRRTAYIGTVNSQNFLIDETGNRRFWTVPIEQVDLERLRAFDALQLWKQIERDFVQEKFKGNENGCYRLTPAEQSQLAQRNNQHEKPLPAQREIEDIVFSAVPDKSLKWGYTTVSAFIEDNPTLKRYSAEQVGRALDKLQITASRRRVNGMTMRVRFLPLSNYEASQWKTDEAVNSENSTFI